MDYSLLFQIAPILAISGCFAGLLAGLLGVGGGIIFVPVLFFIFMRVLHLDSANAIMLATSTSLATMIPTSISSCISHFKRGNIDIFLLKSWIPYLIIGVTTGIIFSKLFGGAWLTILFGFLLLFSAFNMFFLAKYRALFSTLPKMPYQGIIPFFISSVSVMLGIGGGTLTVPSLSIFNYDTKKATGTAACCGLFICLPGAIMTLVGDFISESTIKNAPPLTFGHISFLAVIMLIPFAILCAPIGVKINKRISPAVIKIIFAILLIITSVRMLLSGFNI
jgi:uncharacterized membrane protein YfcA